MRILAIGIAGLVVVGAPAVALGESAEELRARGEQLAKDGRYSEAIDAFKAAEKLEPRARHACFIALAYTRREAWAQAEIFLDACHQRASAADPLPEWVPMVDQLLGARIALAAPIEIKVEPANVEAKLSVSSFALDEQIVPRTIHLAPGRHVIVASAKGYTDAQKTVEVSDKTPQAITLTLVPVPTTVPEPAPPARGGDGDAPRESRSKVPLAVMGAGVGVGLVGAAVHVLVYWPARKDLAKLGTASPGYDEAVDTWRSRRNVTIGLYGVAAATVITGAILDVTVFKNKEAPVQVGLSPHEGGGIVTVEWPR